jgi:hypothetical protein
MKNKIFLTAAASLLALSLSTGASAALIDGSLAYSTLSGSPAWTFDHTANTVTIGQGEVDYVSGDLGSIALGTTIAALPTFTYDVFVPSVNIWNLGGFTFDLDSVTSYIEYPGASGLYLTGMGTVSAAGFTDTTMGWTISGNQFSFAASTVPEPSVIALFGLGLLGLGLARRKIRS